MGAPPPPDDGQSTSFQIRDQILSAQELVGIVGRQTAKDLMLFLLESVGADRDVIVRKIWIRQVRNDGSVGNYVDLHTDRSHAKYKQSTMVVTLNGEDDIEGGEIFYLNQDGVVMPERAKGKAFAHKYDVLHGVAPHSGTRVSLLIHLDHEPSPGIEDLARNVIDVGGVNASLRA